MELPTSSMLKPKTANNDEISKISNSSQNFSHSLSHLTAFPITLSPLAAASRCFSQSDV